MKIKITLLLFLLIALTSCKSLEYTTETDISKYGEYLDNIVNSELLIPNLDELGEYHDINVYYYHEIDEYYLNSITLIITYGNEVEFSTQRQKIENDYLYITENIIVYNSFGLEKEFQYKGFDIYPIQNEEFTYLCNYGMIGYNTEDMQIVYLFIDNPEICHNPYDNSTEYMNEYFDFGEK